MIARPLAALAVFVALGAAPVPAVLAQNAPAPTPLALGATIPMADAKLRNVDGKDVTIAGLKGKKGTLVIFTCNACPWAKKWESRVARIGNDALKRGLGVVAINPNDPERNKEDGYDVMQARAKQNPKIELLLSQKRTSLSAVVVLAIQSFVSLSFKLALKSRLARSLGMGVLSQIGGRAWGVTPLE